MNQDLIDSVMALAGRLVTLAATDEGLRDDLRALAGAVLGATGRPAPTPSAEPGRSAPLREEREPDRPPVEPPPAESPPPADETVAVTLATPEPGPVASPLPELTLGRSRPAEPRPEISAVATPPGRPTPSVAELPAIEARCRLKAEGARWAATRRRRIDEEARHRDEIAPRDRDLLDRAREIECFLWMNTPDFIVPRPSARLEEVAGCFEAMADAVALVRGMLPEVEANREFFEPALNLLAEAQSALRVAVERIDGRTDQDQQRAYYWLREITAAEQIYIHRYMRLNDRADPGLLLDLEGRIEALDARFRAVRGRAKDIKRARDQFRYHAKRIAEGTRDDHDWRKVVGAVNEMVDGGVPASSMEIREILVPILDEMPELDGLSMRGFDMALREIDRYLAGRRTPEAAAPVATTAEVSEAARLLAGKGMVLIGGSRRPEAYAALKAAFGLKDLVWIEGRDHASIERFEPSVARPDMALVILAIRWSSHSFGDVRKFCDRYGKPMVRLPGGYNPNQVAAQILAQCSEQLDGG